MIRYICFQNLERIESNQRNTGLHKCTCWTNCTQVSLYIMSVTSCRCPDLICTTKYVSLMNCTVVVQSCVLTSSVNYIMTCATHICASFYKMILISCAVDTSRMMWWTSIPYWWYIFICKAGLRPESSVGWYFLFDNLDNCFANKLKFLAWELFLWPKELEQDQIWG